MIHACLRVCAVLALAAGLSVSAFAQQEYGDDQYKPSRGQHGKDVIWIPTPSEMVTKMLAAARVTPQDIVYDLGAGDGKIPIAAARDFGARAVGIEYNSDMAALARRNAERAGLGDRVRIITGDIFTEGFSAATVVTLYLLPDLNLRLKPALLAMKPGTRVASNSFGMGDWEPDMRLDAADTRGFFWIVPARVEGRWVLQLPETHGLAKLNLRQSYQKFTGTLVIDGRSFALEEGRLSGAEMSFSYQQASGARVTFAALVAGDLLAGMMSEAGAPPAPFSARRQ